MLNDLLSSPRGPGMLGLALAIVVLSGFGLLFFWIFAESAQSERKRQVAMQSETIGKLEQNLERLRFRHDERKKLMAVAAEAELVQAAHEAAVERASQLAGAIAELEGGLAEFDATLWEWALAERKRAVGEVLPEITTIDGEVFEEAKIRVVDPRGIEIVRWLPEGPKNATLRFERLPDDLRKRFRFSESERDEFVAMANAQRRDQLGARGEAAEERREQREEWDRLRQLENNEREVGELKADIERAHARMAILHQNVEDYWQNHTDARSLGRRSTQGWIRRAEKAEEEIQALERFVEATESRARNLERTIRELRAAGDGQPK